MPFFHQNIIRNSGIAITILFGILALIVAFPANALNEKNQTKVDSVFRVMDSTRVDSQLLGNYLALARIYLTHDYSQSEKYARRSLHVAQQLNDTMGQANAHYLIGYSVYYTIDLPTSLDHYQKALDLYTILDDKKNLATMVADMAYIYGDLGQIEKQIESLKKAEVIFEEIEDFNTLSTIYNNLGLAFSNLGDQKKTIYYYEKSAKLREKHGMYNRIAIVYLNLGLTYLSNGDTVKALEYYNKGYENANEYDNTFGRVIANQRLAGYYYSIGDLKKARKYYNAAWEIDKATKNLEGESLDLFHLANLDIRQKNYKAAEAKALQAMEINNKLELFVRQQGQYEQLTSIYRGLGEYQKALDYQTRGIKIRDSIGQENLVKTLEEMEEKYQNEKKQAELETQQAEIAKLETDKERDQLVIQNQQQQRNFILTGLSLVTILLGISVYAFIQKRKDNREIAEQRHQLMEANEELNQTNEEIMAQRDQIEVQKEILRQHNEHITSSINYAKKIQEALLKNEEHSNVLPEHFVVFKPKDIVSGDFYWFHKREDTLFVAVADCTGHGVPGAFLTMLGTSFLNEIVSNTNIVRPAEILENLRARVVKELSQTGNEPDILDATSQEDIVKDGMDISMVKLNLNHPEIEWAGANNPLFVLTSKSETIEAHQSKKSILGDSKSLVVVNPDKQPIGYTRNKKPFTNQSIKLNKGDSLYLFSDGFADQFGGEKGDKYGYKRFREFLYESSKLPMNVQEEALGEEFDRWMKASNEEQLDDVCVIGLRIT